MVDEIPHFFPQMSSICYPTRAEGPITAVLGCISLTTEWRQRGLPGATKVQVRDRVKRQRFWRDAHNNGWQAVSHKMQCQQQQMAQHSLLWHPPLTLSLPFHSLPIMRSLMLQLATKTLLCIVNWFWWHFAQLKTICHNAFYGIAMSWCKDKVAEAKMIRRRWRWWSRRRGGGTIAGIFS